MLIYREYIVNYNYKGGFALESTELIEGMKAPNFTLPGSDKKDHKLNDYIGRKVVLYFYPKDNTPG